MMNGSSGLTFKKQLVTALSQVLQSMHPQLGTYRNEIWFALLGLMTSNDWLQLVVAFQV